MLVLQKKKKEKALPKKKKIEKFRKEKLDSRFTSLRHLYRLAFGHFLSPIHFFPVILKHKENDKREQNNFFFFWMHDSPVKFLFIHKALELR